MIQFDEGRPTLCGRVTWGYAVGFITQIDCETYRIKWLGGGETTQLRPDVEDDDILQAAAE